MQSQVDDGTAASASKADFKFQVALGIGSGADKAPDVKMKLRIGSMTQAEKSSLAAHEKTALAKVADHTEWVIEETTEKAMAHTLRTSSLGQVRGTASEEGKYVMISYQPKIAAETQTTPHLRIPPLRNNQSMPGGAHFRKMVRAMIASRFGEEEVGNSLHAGDVFVIGDGGKHGNQTPILSAFVSTAG